MNTSFKTIVFVFAIGLPVSLFAQLCGATLPSVIDSSHMFVAFVFSGILLTAFSDYSRRPQSVASLAHRQTQPAVITPLPVQSLDHRLAA